MQVNRRKYNLLHEQLNNATELWKASIATVKNADAKMTIKLLQNLCAQP